MGNLNGVAPSNVFGNKQFILWRQRQPKVFGDEEVDSYLRIGNPSQYLFSIRIKVAWSFEAKNVLSAEDQNNHLKENLFHINKNQNSYLLKYIYKDNYSFVYLLPRRSFKAT